jgi:hypothetical protein
MAIDPTGGHPSMDYAEHIATYKGFLKAAQIGVIGCAVLLIGMYVFLV